MSDLQRSFAKAKLADLPFEPPLPPNSAEELEEEEDEDELQELPEPSPDEDSSSASSASSTGTIRPSLSKHLFARPKGSVGSRKTLDPLDWNEFFPQELYLPRKTENSEITHHAYLIPPSEKGPLFVTHHGAGSSALSFAVCAKEIIKALPKSGVLSIDARGHGDTTIESSGSHQEGNLDLSLETLSQDLIYVIKATQEKMIWQDLPPLLLVGHSLGGAVVTEAAMSGALGNAVLGYAVLDVVEGSAIDALQSMQSYLSTRPRSFPSLFSGIEWHIRSRTIRNSTSSRVSVPSLLRQAPSLDSPNQEPSVSSSSESPTSQIWTWRTDLAATQPFWENWFVGLSSKFLNAKGGKLLLLAGTDRLDKELMIGQMQGLSLPPFHISRKYQLQVFQDSGHFIHEDLPQKTAMVLVDFYRRNDRSAMVLPPKVGDLLKMGRKI
ncbi:MAG: Protein phosphatase methylesterase 1 [Icmadophila ericetorum]|nr:Protein phosphatase methylesterase 1 [Icmadophila ericetorum]